MSCLSRKVVENRLKRQNAKDEGNIGLLFGLIIVGGLLFAGHSMLTQMHHVHKSLKDMLSSIVNRNTIKQVGEELATDEARELAPHLIKEDKQR